MALTHKLTINLEKELSEIHLSVLLHLPYMFLSQPILICFEIFNNNFFFQFKSVFHQR